MSLTDIKVKKAQPKEKQYRLSDGKGLCLVVRPNGSKLWHYRYRFAGKEKTFSIGPYPEISLKQARIECTKARLLVAESIDPCQKKQIFKADLKEAHKNSFKIIAMDWFIKTKVRWKDSTVEKQLWILEKNLFPYIGTLPITEIKPPDVLKALRKIEKRGALETARRAKQVAGQVFRYAVATGVIESDPTRDLAGALMAKKTKHHAAITTPEQFGKLLVDIDNYQGTEIVRSLLAITPLVFQRPGEVRKMEWAEIDFDQSLWHASVDKMKMQEPHIVPLSRQAIRILKDIQPLTGWGKFVFSNQKNRSTPASDGTVNKALRNMGYTRDVQTAHGFRASARTMLDEVLEFPPYLIEQQISHKISDPLGRAYNRTSHLKQRKEMMQRWADYLDALKASQLSTNVIFYKKEK